MENNKSNQITTETILEIANNVFRDPRENWQDDVQTRLIHAEICLLDDVEFFNSEQDTNIVCALWAEIDGLDAASYVLRLSDDGEWSLDSELPVDYTDQPHEYWAAHVVDIPAVVVHPGHDSDSETDGYYATYWDGDHSTSYEGCFFDDLSDALRGARLMGEV